MGAFFIGKKGVILMIELNKELFYTVEEVADRMKVSKKAVRDGKLKASRFGKRLYIPAESIKQTLEKNFISQGI